jgi:hypothetical protein
MKKEFWAAMGIMQEKYKRIAWQSFIAYMVFNDARCDSIAEYFKYGKITMPNILTRIFFRDK